jgi:hypothetical protein
MSRVQSSAYFTARSNSASVAQVCSCSRAGVVLWLMLLTFQTTDVVPSSCHREDPITLPAGVVRALAHPLRHARAALATIPRWPRSIGGRHPSGGTRPKPRWSNRLTTLRKNIPGSPSGAPVGGPTQPLDAALGVDLTWTRREGFRGQKPNRVLAPVTARGVAAVRRQRSARPQWRSQQIITRLQSVFVLASMAAEVRYERNPEDRCDPGR